MCSRQYWYVYYTVQEVWGMDYTSQRVAVINLKLFPDWPLSSTQQLWRILFNKQGLWVFHIVTIIWPRLPKTCWCFCRWRGVGAVWTCGVVFEGGNLSVETFFNYRLQRECRFIECAFGLLSNKWQLFRMPLNVPADFANYTLESLRDTVTFCD